jgi:hypothetical protein
VNYFRFLIKKKNRMADPGDPVTEQSAKKEEGVVEGAEVVETVPPGEADADTAVAKVEKKNSRRLKMECA